MVQRETMCWSFESLGMSCVCSDKRAKLGSHMERCIFIGCPDGYKGWKFYNPETDKVIICELADFDERYTYKGQVLTPKESIDPEPQPLIPGIENDALPDVKVQKSDQTGD